MSTAMDIMSDEEEEYPKNSDFFGLGLELEITADPKRVPPLIGSESSSTGDELERRLSSSQLISGKGRSVEQEQALEMQRDAVRKRLDEEEMMMEMDQDDIDHEDGIDDAREGFTEQRVLEEWKRVQEERREAGLEEKAKLEVKPRRSGWKNSPAKRKRKKKPPAAAKSQTKKKKKKKTKVRKDAAAEEEEDDEEDEPQSPPPPPMTAGQKEQATAALAAAAADWFEDIAADSVVNDPTPEAPTGKSKRTAVQPLAQSSKHPAMRYLGDFGRACLVTLLWGGKDKPNPPEESLQMVSVVLPNANRFMEAGKELGERIVESCSVIFKHTGNETLELVLKAVCDVNELHVQPTVRKAPSDNTVDVWTGDVLVKEMLNGTSSLVFNPAGAENEPSSVLISKQPATMFSLIHFLLHFGDYCKKVAHTALMKCQSDLKPGMAWDDAWTACIGPSWASQNFTAWPKSSKTTNPLGTAIVKMREWINACIWLDAFLEAELERLSGDEEGPEAPSD